MAISVLELAQFSGTQALGGDPKAMIEAAANIDEADATQVTFIGSSKYLGKLTSSRAAAVFVPKDTPANSAPASTALLPVDDPEIAFISCLHRLYPRPRPPATRSEQAFVDSSAQVGSGTTIEPFVHIGARARIGKGCHIAAGCHIGEDVVIGDNCVLHPNVVLYYETVLGDEVIIHAGTVIGADGFGYKLRNGRHVKFPQVGNVVIGSQVEIGANTCIDRAALGATRIGEGTKMDNQVHIAHNVQIGNHVLMCGQVGIGGSTIIGDYAVLASQCGVADHVQVGSQALVYAQAGVTKDVAPKDQMMGYPATNRREALHEMAALRKLAGNQKALDELARLLPALQQLLEKAD